MKQTAQKKGSSSVFKIGTVTLVFLIIAYQAALFVNRAAIMHIEAQQDRPDTVYIIKYIRDNSDATLAGSVGASAATQHPEEHNSGSENGTAEEHNTVSANGAAQHPEEHNSGSENGTAEEHNTVSANGAAQHPEEHNTASANGTAEEHNTVIARSCERQRGRTRQSSIQAPNASPYHNDTIRASSNHSPRVKAIRAARAEVESFRFNPNTASIDDLMRLGFSQKQAQAIDNYRLKGGQFRRKSDFARSFVVSDSIYQRLEAYIDIPKLDINLADSAAFDALPGIGPYYASKMVEMRERLGGYSYPEQLMDIWQFDSTRFAPIADLLTCSPAKPYPLWSLDVDQLRLHPYIGSYQIAKAIVFYREHNTRDRWTISQLETNGVISSESASKLARCQISPAE